jgi:hypothetical protein
MTWFITNERQMLLGQLLIDEDLISESELAQAVDQQKKTGQRLGDVIAELELISRQQVSAIIRKQRMLRLIASIATTLFGSMYAYTAAAVPVAPLAVRAGANTYKPDVARTLRDGQIAVSQKASATIKISGLDVEEDSLQAALEQLLEPITEAPQLLEPMDAALQIVELHHSRVAQTIRVLWGDRQCSEYINKVLLDGYDDHGQVRMGFHHEAVDAMLKLNTMHEQKFASPEMMGEMRMNKSASFSSSGGVTHGQFAW